jgi:hypothetical protein
MPEACKASLLVTELPLRSTERSINPRTSEASAVMLSRTGGSVGGSQVDGDEKEDFGSDDQFESPYKSDESG